MKTLILTLLFIGCQNYTKSAVKIVAFGDSTTFDRYGYTNYVDNLRAALPEKYGRPFEIINSGWPSNTTEQGRARFQKDVLDHKPDFVIIQFGINDSLIDFTNTPPATAPRVSLERYRENLEHFVTSAKAQGAKVILMTPNPIYWTWTSLQAFGQAPYNMDTVDGFNVLLKDYAEVSREVAKKYDLYGPDIQAIYLANPRAWVDWLCDGMHSTDAGYKVITDEIMKYDFGGSTK